MKATFVLLAAFCILHIQARPLDDETAETEEQKRSKLAKAANHKPEPKADMPSNPSTQAPTNTAAGTTAKPPVTTAAITNIKNAVTTAAAASVSATKRSSKVTTQPPVTVPPTTGAPSTTGGEPTTAPPATTLSVTTAPATTAPIEPTGAEPTVVTTTKKHTTIVSSTKKITTTPPVEKKPTGTLPTLPTIQEKLPEKGDEKSEEKLIPVFPSGGKLEEKPEEPDETVGENNVEGSTNQTSSMVATTFHVAIRLLKEKFTDDLQFVVNPVYISMKRMLQVAIEKIYKNYVAFRQFALIKFSPGSLGKGVGRQTVPHAPGDGVIADFYLRFYNPGVHLNLLADQVKTGLLDTHPVSKKFVRAYTAEPKGRVCTPDCKVQCYSYCDQGCCNTMYHMQVRVPQQPGTMLPGAGAPPAPAPQPVPQPTFALPPAQPAPFPNYSPLPAPLSFTSHCPSQCSSFCAPTCPNACCQSGYQGNSMATAAAATAPSPSFPVAAGMPASYPQMAQPFQAAGGCQQGMAGCG